MAFTPPRPHGISKHSRATWVITFMSLVYATVRYNVFKGVPWSDWPVYVVNNALALSSLLILLTWILRARLGPDESMASLLSNARRLALVHAGLSLAILSPAYFPAFFLDGKLSWPSGVSVLLGAVAASGLNVTPRPDVLWLAAVRRVGVVGLMAGTPTRCSMATGAGLPLSRGPGTWLPSP
jgi:hypothetical protein